MWPDKKVILAAHLAALLRPEQDKLPLQKHSDGQHRHDASRVAEVGHPLV